MAAQGGRVTGKLVGILTNRDVRFATNERQKISELMTHENLITVRDGVGKDEAKALLHRTASKSCWWSTTTASCVGLITVKDIEKAQLNPMAVKDAQGRLRVAAASTVGDKGYERSMALIEAGVDLLVIDTAHGHSVRVAEAVERVKRESNSTRIVAGNVATAEATQALIDAGADSIKVGIGPGSICTTRIVAGVGVPQLAAVMACAEEADKSGVPVIADGGIKFSGDLAKALAGGASCAMVGSLLAGTDESPGEVYLYQGRRYKAYRGMGSVGAMARGSADRYFQQEVRDSLKLVPEGIEGQVPYKGPAGNVLHQLAGGLRAAMGYTGAHDLEDFRDNAAFVKISGAALSESHVHDVTDHPRAAELSRRQSEASDDAVGDLAARRDARAGCARLRACSGTLGSHPRAAGHQRQGPDERHRAVARRLAGAREAGLATPSTTSSSCRCCSMSACLLALYFGAANWLEVVLAWLFVARAARPRLHPRHHQPRRSAASRLYRRLRRPGRLLARLLGLRLILIALGPA